ncbi:MAG TPA: hypothetical protein PK323_05155 [Bacteroidia bacterium]|nr:hypothetical protein [Bacteroidia bacterium]
MKARYKSKKNLPALLILFSFFFVSCTKNSVEKMQDKGWSYLNTQNSILPQNRAMDIKADQRGSIWVSFGSSQFISKINPTTKNITNYKVPLMGLKGETGILRIFIDKIDRIWVTSGAGMAYRLTNENKWDTLDLTKHYQITDIDFDSNNNAWIGTNNALLFYDGSKYVKYNEKNSGLVSDEFVSVKIINDNLIWLVTFGSPLWNTWPSITKYENGNFILKGGGPNNINTGLGPYAGYVYKDKKGRLFFCSNFITVLDGENITIINGYVPFGIAEVNNYYLFVTLESGLIVYDFNNKKAKFLNPDNSGLPTLKLSGSIVVNPDSTVWLTTEEYGIAIWDLKNTNKIIL